MARANVGDAVKQLTGSVTNHVGRNQPPLKLTTPVTSRALTKTFTPTPEQATLFATTGHVLTNMDPHLNALQSVIQVIGVAGCGKTETSVRDILTHPDYKKYFLAFGKNASMELESRLAAVGIPDVASTYHVFGKDIVNRTLTKKPRIAFDKVYDHMDNILPASIRKNKKLRVLLKKAVELAKGELLYPINVHRDVLLNHNERMIDLLDEHEISADAIVTLKESGMDIHDFVKFTAQLVISTTMDHSQIDFPDMLSMAAYHGWTLADHNSMFDILYIDEYQDSNKAQEWLALTNSRVLVTIGDPNQAIFGFRGAGNDSMEHIVQSASGLGAEVYQTELSYNWRCAKSIIRLAQQLVPRIKHRPDANEGMVLDDQGQEDIVNYCSQIYGGVINGEPVEFDDRQIQSAMIISRNNAPLFRYAIRLLKSRIPIFRYTSGGKDDPIVAAITKALHNVFGCRTQDIAITTLNNYFDEMRRKVYDDQGTAQDLDGVKGVKARARLESRLLFINDIHDCCKVIMEAAQEPANYSKVLAELTPPYPEKGAVILSTIHKAKGNEADIVFIIGTEFLGRGLRFDELTGSVTYVGEIQYDELWGEVEGEEPLGVVRFETKSQELNVVYVAVTRAKHVLVFEGLIPAYLRMPY